MNAIDQTFLPVQRAMDLSSARMAAIAKNLAHADTPGFQRLKVDFQSLLDASRIRDDARRLEALQDWRPELSVDQDAPLDERGNSVKLEQEIALMHKTLLHHEVAAQLAAGKIAGLRLALNGR